MMKCILRAIQKAKEKKPKKEKQNKMQKKTQIKQKKTKPTYENEMHKKETTTTIFLQAYSLYYTYIHTHKVKRIYIKQIFTYNYNKYSRVYKHAQ